MSINTVVNVGTEGHPDIRTKCVSLDSFPSYFESSEFTSEQVEYLLKRISQHRYGKTNKKILITGLTSYTEIGSMWIDEMLAAEEHPLDIKHTIPFWANDWKKKHKRR